MTTPASADRIRQYVEEERERFAVPGCAVLVVADGEVVLADGFGMRNLDRGLPVTAQTLFPIGSSTKTFTAALCASLVDAGILEWDQPIRSHLPGFRMQDPVATELLSTRDCLSHRSGLPRHDMLWVTGEGRLDRDGLIAALADLEPSKPFRQTWQYNNLLYVTIGHLAGRLAGGSFEDAVRRLLLDPLGMQRTNFSVDETQSDADHSRPYVITAPATPAKEVPYASLDMPAPAGAINSCVAEMTPWLLTLLGRGVDGRPPLLSEAVLQELRTPTMPLPAQSPVRVGRPVGYGLGLFVEDYRGFRVVHHGGNIDGFSSMVSAIPEAGLGVVVLTNLAATALRDALPYRIYDLLLGLEPRPHGVTLHERQTALEEGAAEAKRRQTTSSKPLAAVRPSADYVGTYRHAAYGDVVVRLVEDALRVDVHGLDEARLEHRHLEVFDFWFSNAGADLSLPAQFTHDLAGEVDALRLTLEATVSPVRFDRRPDTGHLTDELLDSFAGSYFLGPVSAVVSRRGDRELLLSLDRGEPAPLRPVRGGSFALGSAVIEFCANGRLLTPYGDFLRQTIEEAEQLGGELG
ncbi:MAG: serine hydrolase [Actinobacteria bacterium]|nr:serine hydrolase [Actinomycetota bacterium]